jgi:hypothetical protein
VGKYAKCLFFDRAYDDLTEQLKGQYIESGQIEFVMQDLTFLEKIEQISNQIKGLQDR